MQHEVFRLCCNEMAPRTLGAFFRRKYSGSLPRRMFCAALDVKVEECCTTYVSVSESKGNCISHKVWFRKLEI